MNKWINVLLTVGLINIILSLADLDTLDSIWLAVGVGLFMAGFDCLTEDIMDAFGFEHKKEK